MIHLKSINEITLYLKNCNANERYHLVRLLENDQRKGIQKLITAYYSNSNKEIIEKNRIKELWKIEQTLQNEGYQMIAGVDEVGRGCLAGPVVASAVILPFGKEILGINDSKKITSVNRIRLAEVIKNEAIDFGIGVATVAEIDQLNILHAAELAMERAVLQLTKASVLLVDGLNKLDLDIKCVNVVRGDSKSISIAAGSILAKVYRDELMRDYHDQYPQYGFDAHKGYATNEHYQAIKEYGTLSIHRKTFKLIK